MVATVPISLVISHSRAGVDRSPGRDEASAQTRGPAIRGPSRGARKYVLQNFAITQSAMMKRRVAQFLTSADCPICKGKRLRPEPLSVTFAGMDIAEISRLPLMKLDQLLKPYLHVESTAYDGHPEKALVAQRIMEEMRHSTGARKGAQVHTRRSCSRKTRKPLGPGQASRGG